MLNLEYSKKLKNVGKIIVCLIKYANDEDIKVKRNDVEPEFLREMCNIVFTSSTLLDLCIIGLGIGVVISRIILLFQEILCK